MNEFLLSDEAGRLAPGIHQWFQYLFAEGHDTPIEASVNLVLFLASGNADALSGCFISVTDDAEDLVRRADEIRRDDLLMLRLRRRPDAQS
jgi:hypothetical protein